MTAPDWQTAFLRRVDERLKALGLSDRKASLRATQSTNPDAIRNIRRGFVPKADTVTRLAEVLEIPRDLLLDALPASAPEESLVTRAVGRSLKTVQVVGHVQAGDWREALEWPEEERYRVSMMDDGRHPGADRFALEVRGDSMNALYPPGSIVVAVRMGDLARPPKSGDRIVCLRRDRIGQFEATLKEFQIDEHGRRWLVPRSHNPEHRPILLTDEPEVGTEAELPADAYPAVVYARSFDDGAEPDITVIGLVVQSIKLE